MRESGGPSFEGYRVLRELSSGGMARVFKCLRESDGTVVAIKRLKEELAGVAEVVDTFEHEARAAGAIGHPNVVKIFDVIRTGTNTAIVMEYVKGRPLSAVMGERGKLPVKEALRITRELADALAAAHERGVTHRDVKPSNIMIDENGSVRLVDFGIARAIEAVSMEMMAGDETIAGTAEYMSPEQGQGAGVDARSDIYSLGIVLYEMLTGGTPFRGAKLMVVLSHAQDEPKRPSALCDGISGPVDDIVMTMLQKRPERRFQTAGEVGEKITAVIGESANQPRVAAAAGVPEARDDEPADEDSKPTKFWSG